VSRIAVLCPGRGSYTKRSLGSLPAGHEWVQRADALRRDVYGLETLTELDGARRFQSATHLRPDHVSPLIYLVTMLDAAQAMQEHEAVCVAGNSMGWYTALAVAGALSFEDGFRLVQEMALLQMEHTDGGQILYPLVDAHWHRDPRQDERVRAAIESSGGEAFESIRLGGYAVLAGSERGLAHLLKELPYVEMGPSLFPYRLAQHGPYHTPLLEGVARKARERLAGLDFARPRVTLVDGRGRCHAPWSSDPGEIRDYTLGVQITTPFDFTASVRVGLREFAPDLLALPGPGNSLGGICGQVLVAEGWRGIRARDEFERAQESARPPVWSMRRT